MKKIHFKSLNSVFGLALASILFILLGLVLLLWPDLAGKIVCYALGALILIFAVTRIVSFFTDKKVYFIFNFDIVVGIIALGLAVFMLLKPEFVMSILPFVLGIFLIFSGILDFQKSLLLRDYGNTRWKSSLVLACIKFAFGVVLTIIPFLIVSTFIRLIGIGLIYNGLSELWIVSRWPKEASGDIT